MKHELLIIGAGAAGITAAITAKDYGMDTAIIEANDRVGKKILTTGNGRCNITNKTIDASLKKYQSLKSNGDVHYNLAYHSSNKDFSASVESFHCRRYN